MTNIDRDLISNKPSCYVFDIDGCLADVHEILLTYEQTYDIKYNKFLEERDEYHKQFSEYERQLKKYNKGEVDIKPKEPTFPVEPIRQDKEKLQKIDWEYFKDHLLEAIPIQGVLDLFTSIASSHKVILLTGRSDRHRAQTVEWIKKVVIEKGGNDLFRRINFQLIMREDKEMSLSGAKYKRAKILELSKQYNIQLCIEDCPEIVKELTELGLLVLTPNREYYRVGQE